MKDHHRMRAWDNQRKKYVSGVNWVEWNVDKDGIITAKNYNMERTGYQVLIIEQCTGLPDKNGKPIYEGDTFKVDEEIAVVVFRYGTFGYYWKSNQTLFNKDIVWLAEEGDPCGTIHENPELLEEQ